MFFKFTFLWFGIYKDLVISEISTDFVTKNNVLKIVKFVGLFIFLFLFPNIFFLVQQGELENCPEKSVWWAVETWKVVFDSRDEGEKMKEIVM